MELTNMIKLTNENISQEDNFYKLTIPKNCVNLNDFKKYNYEETQYFIVIKGSNLYDMISELYNINPKYILNKITNIPICKFIKLKENAVSPIKHRPSDVGYDLTIISLDKDISEITKMYGTGISIRPPMGYYTKIVPRSSLSKSGYILSNSVGIIDEGFLGELKVVLSKIDKNAPDIKLPFTCVQLILEKHIYFNMQESPNIIETKRGDGGFGSTNKLSLKENTNFNPDFDPLLSYTQKELNNFQDSLKLNPVTKLSDFDIANKINSYTQKYDTIINYDFGMPVGPPHDSVFESLRVMIEFPNSSKQHVIKSDEKFKNKKDAKKHLNQLIYDYLCENNLIS